jgi:hypothetical protein
LNFTAIPVDSGQSETALQVQVSLLLTTLCGAAAIRDNSFLMHAPEKRYHAGNLRRFQITALAGDADTQDSGTSVIAASELINSLRVCRLAVQQMLEFAVSVSIINNEHLQPNA